MDPQVKGVRIVQPPGAEWNIEMISLPFVMQKKETDLESYLQKAGWKERDMHGNSTNCLIPGLVEKIVYDRIGYHPELNLLSREVITGFMPKDRALTKLAKITDRSRELDAILKKKSRESPGSME